MRWLLIILLMCNGIYFVWQGYLVEQQVQVQAEGAKLVEHTSSLSLLSERVSDAAKVKDPSEVLPVPESEGPKVCWMIGPFKELISSKQAAGRMAALDIKLEVRQIAVQGEPDYWVHVPPLATRKLALKKLRELQAKKIDSFLVTEGELANGISLGFFTSKARAEAVYNKRKAQGYKAEIKLVPRTHTEIWLVSDQQEGEKISDSLWNVIKEGNTGIERRKNYCNTIASGEKLE